LPERRDVGTGIEHDVLDTELAGFLQPPGVHALAADLVLVFGAGLEHGDAEPLAGQRGRQRRAADTTPDDDHVRDVNHWLPPRPRVRNVFAASLLADDRWLRSGSRRGGRRS